LSDGFRLQKNAETSIHKTSVTFHYVIEMVFNTVQGDLISQHICMSYKIYVITNKTGSVPQVQ